MSEETMIALLDKHTFQEKSEEIDQISEALIGFQNDFEKVVADSKGRTGNLKYKYADLVSLFEATREPRFKHGLAVTSLSLETDGKSVKIKTVLLHKSGQYFASIMATDSADITIKQAGGALTYIRRYLMLAILGIAPDKDDDGNSVDKSQNKANEASGAMQFDGTKNKNTIDATTEKLLKKLIVDTGTDVEKVREIITKDWGAESLAQITPEQGETLRKRLEEKLLEKEGTEAFEGK